MSSRAVQYKSSEAARNTSERLAGESGIVTLREVGETERAALWNVLQKYLHELSAYYPLTMDGDGNYPYPYFDLWFREPERTALWIGLGRTAAGFALLNRWSCLDAPIDHAMAEFTIFPRFRRGGLGREAVRRILSRYPGRWELKYAKGNQAAKAFWTAVAAAYSPAVSLYHETETVLSFPVPGLVS
ncbi:MAG: hypothetical protein IJT94_05465 [Oscillibacter sp.]|nr:hypothetical protein [Oscillibacter sp.]